MKLSLFLPLMAAILATTLLVVESGRDKKSVTPGETIRSHDAILGTFKACKPDGTEEIICANGVRRPIFRFHRIVCGPLPWLESSLRDVIDGLPASAFPLLWTEEEGRGVCLINLKNGAILHASR
ncbi:MAG: hypothetical protein U0793_14490 [Gemmataceae bacterium]